VSDWKYDGFISYSTRADGELAPKIQEGLEQLAKPWNRRKALKIFQDVDDLVANPDLEETLLGELKGSNTLIYLASPESAASKWCGDELDYWIETRPAEQLVVVLTGGTLDFDKDQQPPVVLGRSTAAPPAFSKLTSVPLYLDLRDHADTDGLDFRTDADFRAKLTKISAALHTNKTDKTVEPRDIDSIDLREHRRGQRFRRLAVSGLIVITVAAVVAMIVAILNGQEADRQRSQAEVQTATALARLGEASASDDMSAGLAAAAKGYQIVQNDTTEWTLIKLLLETRPLEWTLDLGEQIATAAVPVGELAVVGTDDGSLSLVTPDGELIEIVADRGSPVADITPAPDESTVAVAWEDGHLLLYDTGSRETLLTDDWDHVPLTVAPYVSAGPAVVAFARDAGAVIGPSGEREIGPGLDPDGFRVFGPDNESLPRLRVVGDILTYADFSAVEIDLVTGESFAVPTGGNRGWVWDAAARVAVSADDRSTGVGLYPFGPESDTLYGDAADLDHALTFDRERIPVDDITLSGDGQAVATLSGEVLEVWTAGPETGERGFSERIVLLEGVTQPAEGSPRLELSDDGTTAVTSGGSIIQRWDAGRIEVTPEISFGGAMDAYIGVGVTDSEVYWASSSIGKAPAARLAFEDGSWAVLEGSAAIEALQRIEDVFSDTDERVSPDGILGARADNQVITLRSLPERVALTTLNTQADGGYLTFSPDGHHLVLASRGGGLEYWPLILDALCPALDLRVGPGTTKATCGTTVADD
jgi:hypothetical protein